MLVKLLYVSGSPFTDSPTFRDDKNLAASLTAWPLFGIGTFFSIIREFRFCALNITQLVLMKSLKYKTVGPLPVVQPHLRD